MKFMLLVKANAECEAGVLPTPEKLEEMGKFNQELEKAGVLLDLNGLQASSKGARINFSNSHGTVTDGPFTETKELVAGYWLLQTKSRDEAIGWALRAPFVDGQIEVRQVFELCDFLDAHCQSENP